MIATISCDAGVGGFEDGVGRERRRHEDHRRVGAGLLDGFGDGVEHRQARRPSAPPLPGVTPPTIFVPYSRQFLVWNSPDLAGDALADDAGVLVDQDAHVVLEC